jgi:6-phosphogluconolactonase
VSDVHRFDSAAALAEAASRAIASLAAAAIEREGGFRLGLSGGRTPAAVYRTLGAGSLGSTVDWSRATFLFADERDAPPHEPESNYWEVRKQFLEPAGVPPDRIHRMKADQADLEAEARAYEPLLAQPLDLLLLGIGEDGHTASLFPGSPLVRERTRRVAAVFDSPKPPPRRLTVTPRVIAEARALMVLATGEAKAEAVARALGETGDEIETPARLARHGMWYLDAAAAGRLPAVGR